MTLYQRVEEEFVREKKDIDAIQKNWFLLQPRLVICGGGHVAIQVAKMAKLLDFYVQVIDDRAEFVVEERFPDADERCCHRYEDVAEIFPKESNTYYVVVTRGHEGDRSCVEQILKRRYAYLGMIGSKTKVAKTAELLINEGYEQKAVEGIHAPIGLAIQAQTPAEIAISILAEIIACKNSIAVSSMSKELMNTQESGTLCIITGKRGSSPRNVGSMMFVQQDGSIIGSVGGGSVESEVIKHAAQVQEIEEKTYDLSNSESAQLGMICGGSNRIMFIPLQ